MVEIGPGLAALTQPLVERLGRLHVIELDRDLAARLREHPQLQVIESDVLRVDFTQLAADLNVTKLRVVGTCLQHFIADLVSFAHACECHHRSTLHAAKRSD